MIAERKQVGWGFWLWWVLATSLGFVVGLFLFVFGVSVLEEAFGHGESDNLLFVYFLIATPVVGVAVGTAQWLVLKQQVSNGGGWMLATTIGFTVGVIFLILGVGGVAIGIAQMVVLERRVNKAGWWVAASTIGWGVGVTMSLAVTASIAFSGIGDFVSLVVIWLVGIIVSGAIPGAITGWLLVRLLRQPSPEAS